jgi:hypothetical protein
VCACWDAGFRPRPRHATAASAAGGRATRPPARHPVMGGGSSEIAKGAGRCPQVANRLWATDRPRRPWALLHGHGRRAGLVPARRPAAGSSMEGTSGAADSGPLRGGTGGAALGGIAEGAPRTGSSFLAGRRSRAAPDRCSAGVSSRRRSGSTTRGVRADRVGKTLSAGRPQGRRPNERRPSKRGSLLTREDSTGDRPSRLGAGRSRRARKRALERPAKGRRGVATRARCRDRHHHASALLERRACRYGLRTSRKRGRRAERASARSGCTRRGSDDRAGVLADCGGCRSRRAALGPDRKVTGLAPRLLHGSSGGERAPEAGSQWREPRAREQRHR